MRPFFSVIISCYNSKNTLEPLLQSLIKQYLPKEDLQVIISDDCSTESYQEILDRYQNVLNLTVVQTAYNCCPGNTRQRGSEAATGEWLCFSDHDDIFIENTFYTVKQQIEKSGIDTFVTTSFIHQKFDDKDTIKQYSAEEARSLSWTHGKFYNLDNFWKKYRLRYKKDLKSHEDVYLSTSIDTIVNTYHIKTLNINLPTYIWYWREDSLSNRKYTSDIQGDGDRRFIDLFLIDYLTATIGVYFERNEIMPLDTQYFKRGCCQVILYSYYYSEQAKYLNPIPMKRNYREIQMYLQKMREQFNIGPEEIFNVFKQDRAFYKKVFESSLIATGHFIPEITFKDWLIKIIKGNFEEQEA